MTTWWMAEEFGRGGIARYAADVASFIAGTVERVVVATTPSGPAPGFDGHSVVWFPVAGGLVAQAAGAVWGLARAAQQPRRGDVVWIPLGIRPGYDVLLATAVRTSGAKLVATVHNRAPHSGGRESPLVVAAARMADVVVVHTGELEQWGRQRHLRVTRLPFPPPQVRGGTGRHTRFSLRIPDDHVCLLMFGNLSPYKGWRHLLRALATARARDPDLPLTLVLAGRATGAEPLDEAPALGVAAAIRRLPGYIEDDELDDLLSLADAVALPYLGVDHSGAGALAASRGLSALASDLPTLRELFGDAALYVPPGDVGRLAEALSAFPAALAGLRQALAPATADVRGSYQEFARTFRV
jgi:glycosyltransferase involved in cell wall biosynthesis